MPKIIAMFMYDGGQSLDIAGPMEVFSMANRQQAEDQPGSAPLYRLCYVARQRGTVTMDSGLVMQAGYGFSDLDVDLDTLLISGGMGRAPQRVVAEADTIKWIQRTARRSRRVGSICTGALVLAVTGLLNGRRSTTHWRDVAELARLCPETTVIPDAIYVRDDPIWTSAGITAGMDMALAMLAADHGMPLALKVAKRMVMVTKRSGGQTQFSQQLDAQACPDVFAELVDWLQRNLTRDIDVTTMAEHVHMSERHFRRRFSAVFNTSPQKYLQQLRLEAAKALLENTRREIKAIAVDCGFGSEETMRRAFGRELGVRPQDYRHQFSALV